MTREEAVGKVRESRKFLSEVESALTGKEPDVMSAPPDGDGNINRKYLWLILGMIVCSGLAWFGRWAHIMETTIIGFMGFSIFLVFVLILYIDRNYAPEFSTFRSIGKHPIAVALFLFAVVYGATQMAHIGALMYNPVSNISEPAGDRFPIEQPEGLRPETRPTDAGADGNAGAREQ